MAATSFNLKATSKLQQISNVLKTKARRKLADNVGEIRQITADAINRAVEKDRNQFIPTDDEAAQLGVGDGGEIDTDKTNGAWRELLTTGQATKFVVQKTGSSAGNVFANIQIVISEDALYNAAESNISIPVSKKPDAQLLNNIPWMKWLIEGAITDTNYRFDEKRVGRSRTGGGIMVKGGIWNFPPARPSAFDILTSSIEKNIAKGIKSNIGKIL